MFLIQLFKKMKCCNISIYNWLFTNWSMLVNLKGPKTSTQSYKLLKRFRNGIVVVTWYSGYHYCATSFN